MGRPIQNRKARWFFALFTAVASTIFIIIASSGLVQLYQTGRVVTPDGTIKEGDFYWTYYGLGLACSIGLACIASMMFLAILRHRKTNPN